MRRFVLACLILVTMTASAERLTTFGWDIDPSWLPGTTIELCGTGEICQSGITGTQGTLLLPVSQGEVINGRARAIPPDGYQCGFPPTDCPPSDWVMVTQTWPSAPIGRWAWKEGLEPMAISYLGYTAIEDSDGTFSQTVTVPANTSHALLFIGGWSASGNGVSSISLGGTAATSLIERGLFDSYQDMFAYIVATSAGSLTFSASMTRAFEEGGVAVIVYLGGVDTTTPLVDSDFHETDSIVLNPVTRTLDTVADGIGVVFATIYHDPGKTNFSVTDQSQTQIVKAGPFNSDDYGAAYKLTPSTGTADFGISDSGPGYYHAGLYVTLRPSSGAAAVSSPPNNPIRNFAHLLVR
jgi:hypothetical protein